MKCSDHGGLRKGPEAWAVGVPYFPPTVPHLGRSYTCPHTLDGAGRGHLQSAPCPALRALPACGLSRQPAGLAYHCGPWASREEVQPGGKGGGKTLVVMVTTHGHRMPFQKVWVGVHSSPCGGKGHSSGEKNCCSLGTDASRGGEEQAQCRARRSGSGRPPVDCWLGDSR